MGLRATGVSSGGRGNLSNHSNQIRSKGEGILADHHNQIRPKGDGIMLKPAQVRSVIRGHNNGIGGRRNFIA